MNISAPFIRRPIGTSLIMAALVLIGLAAYPFLPVAPLPRIDFPTILVNAKFPGASPETMASTVAQPLERQFAQIPGISQMTSVSVQGQSQIVIQFDLDRNIDGAAGDIQAQINAASGTLPKDLPSTPTYWKINPSDSPILILSVQSDVLPLIDADDYADNILSQQISQIAGVGQVYIGGEQKRAIRVQVDPSKLAAMGLTLEDIRPALVNATVNAPKGTIDSTRRSFTIYDNDQLTKAAGYNDVILAYRNGAPIRVRDIGQAVDGPENATLAGWQSGKRGIILLVFKQPGANVIDTVERIKAALPRLEAAIPPSVHVSVVMDRTLTIRAAVDDVQFTLALAVALVVMVIFLFLRSFWATVIPAITVPVALICTFAAMYMLSFSLDNLSLMALTISVGFVVDDAIVMLENIHRHVEEGMAPMEAALKGAGEIGFTIVSISLSLIAVFIPLLLMGGIVGRLFREFAVTVTIAVMVSAFVSLTLTPMMCARFMRHEAAESHGLAWRVVEAGFSRLILFYRRTLDIALRHSFVTLLVFLATVSVTILLYIDIPKGFFPAQDTGVVIGITEGGEDVSFREMSRIQARISDIVAADPDVASFNSTVGTGIGGQTVNNGRMFIALKPFDERVGTAQDFINRIRPKLAAVEGGRAFLQAAQDIRVGGRLSKTEYQYTLQDADLGELFHYAPLVLDRLSKLPMLRDVTTDQQMSGMTATLQIDRDQASRLGVSLQAIDDTLYDAFGQRQITQYFTQINSYHVILEVLPDLADKVGTLERLYVRSANGTAVPLSALAKWTTAPVRPLSISHQSQFPAVTISFNLEGRRTRPGGRCDQCGDGGDAGAGGAGRYIPGHRAGVPELARRPALSDRGGAGHRLRHPGGALPELHPAADYPEHAAVRGRRRAAGVDVRRLRPVGDRADRHHPADRHRQEERHHDGRLRHHTRASRRPAADGRDPRGVPAALPPHPDDHDGGDAVRAAADARPWRGFGAAPPARLRDGGRARAVAGADAYTTPVIYLYLDRLQHWLSPRRAAALPTLAEKMGVAGD